jgi:hypothetical protein
MTAEERLQQHLLMMRGEPPMPLVKMPAIMQALRLRKAGLSYSSISTVMDVYHGCHRTDHAWRNMLRRQGAEPRHRLNSLRLAPQQYEEKS